jgi:peptidoglycan/xylan/chitin deacetylase (PgdA/CDA1 family)
MIKKIIFMMMIFASFLSLSAFKYQLPKVLFVTTGDGDGRGTVSDGVILAIQEFDKLGAFVRLENRKVLFNPQKLEEYTIMILPTTFGYHDADRKYSLSFLSDIEMQNISDWVKKGGTLVSDVYLGRNHLNGEDRIDKNGFLTSKNWSLAECFGVNLQEKNMGNFFISSLNSDIWTGNITKKFKSPEWTPIVANLISKKTKILANWKNNDKKYPAIVQNEFHKGKTILMGSFNIIHPAKDGGFSNSEEIQKFYHYVYDLSLSRRRYNIDLNPWENGAQSAFCLSFDDGGSEKEYQRIFDLINKNDIKATFFVTDNINPKIKKMLTQERLISLGGHSHSHPDFRTLSYAKTLSEFQQNGSNYGNKFKGFRFPFTNNSFWGMKVMEEFGYLYDTSIAVNHLEFYRGSVFPYNIPIFKDGFFQSLDLLEISQNFHDDWYYYQNLDKNKNPKIVAAKFDSYLKSLWKRAIVPNHGLMVFLGHPMYSGINETTIKPVENMVQLAKEDNAWITNLDEVAEYWNKIKTLKINFNENGKKVKMSFNTPNENVIKGLSFKLPTNPKKIKSSEKYSLKNIKGDIFIIFNSIKKGDVVEMEFKD